MKILLVDDDIYSISELTSLLNYEHTLQIPSNGVEALNLYKTDHFDVVSTDIRCLR